MVRIPERSRRSSGRRRSVGSPTSPSRWPALRRAGGGPRVGDGGPRRALGGSRRRPHRRRRHPHRRASSRSSSAARRPASRCPTACRGAATRRAAAACRTITQVLRNDLRFEGLFQFVPDSLLSAIPHAEPGRAELRGLEGHRREDPRDHARRGGRGRRADRRGPRLLRRLRADDARPPLLGPRRQPADLRAPGVRRHHDADPVLGRRAHAHRLRLRPRRDAAAAVEGDLRRRLRRLQPAARDGERARSTSCPRGRPTAPASPTSRIARARPLVYLARIFEGRSTANLTGEKGDAQAFVAERQPRREADRVREHARRQHGRVRGRHRRQRRATAHDDAGLRHGAVLEPDGSRRSPSPRTAPARRRSG